MQTNLVINVPLCDGPPSEDEYSVLTDLNEGGIPITEFLDEFVDKSGVTYALEVAD